MRLRPTEGIHLIALAVLSVLTVALRARLADPRGILLRYALLAGAVLVIARVMAEARRVADENAGFV